MNIILISVGLFVGLVLIYLFVLRPWHLHWGATKQEVVLKLHGDGIVHKPDFNGTRGITINSSPELIWRWIIQIGSKRAGWYSIDWIDNGGIESSDKILPEFQKIEVGQFIPFTPDQKNGLWVKEYKEYEYILWSDKENKASWLWQINKSKDGKTRLLTRLRTKYIWKSIWIIYYLIYDFGDIIMMSICMKGIKKRAEKEFQNNQ